MWQTQTVCDRHRLSVTDADCLWETQTVFDRHRISLIYTACLWPTQTVSNWKKNWHKLCVTNTNYRRQTQTICNGHKLSVTDPKFLWLTKAVCDRQKCLWHTTTVYDEHILRCTRPPQSQSGAIFCHLYHHCVVFNSPTQLWIQTTM